MSLQTDIKSYIEPTYPFVSNIINPGDGSCDNGILFSCTYIHLSRKLSAQDLEYEVDFYNTLSHCQIQPGLYYRYPPPNVKSVESFDDYLGLTSVFPGQTKDIYNYGKKHWWCYNSANPGKFTLDQCFIRMLYVTSVFKSSSGLKLNLWDNLKWIGVVLATNFSATSDTNGRCLMYLSLDSIDKKGGWLGKLANKMFRNNLTKRYTDLSGLYSIYFGPAHPFSVYSKGVPF